MSLLSDKMCSTIVRELEALRDYHTARKQIDSFTNFVAFALELLPICPKLWTKRMFHLFALICSFIND